MSITPKRILFTGCSSSFGSLIRERLLEQGHKVFGVGLGGPDYSVDFSGVEPGFCLTNTVELIFTKAIQAFGSYPDVLINNAGITRIDFMDDHKLEDFCNVINVNLTWPFELCRQFLQFSNVTGDNEVRIINVSSMGATIALRASPGYCASKAGLEALTRVIAKETAGKRKCIALAIAPGGVDNTGMIDLAINDLIRTRGMTREEAIAYNKQSPLKRNMTHEELWKIFDFAVNEAPEYLTGTVIKCTGGMGV